MPPYKNIRHDSDLTRQVDARTFCVSAISLCRFMRPNARTCTHISHCRQSPPHAHALVRLICRLQLHRRQSSLAELIEFSPRDRRERSQSSRWWKDLSQRSSLYPRQKARVLHDRIAIIRVAAAVELSCKFATRRLGTKVTRASYMHAAVRRVTFFHDRRPWVLDPGELNGKNSRNWASICVPGNSNYLRGVDGCEICDREY